MLLPPTQVSQVPRQRSRERQTALRPLEPKWGPCGGLPQEVKAATLSPGQRTEWPQERETEPGVQNQTQMPTPQREAPDASQ